MKATLPIRCKEQLGFGLASTEQSLRLYAMNLRPRRKPIGSNTEFTQINVLLNVGIKEVMSTNIVNKANQSIKLILAKRHCSLA